MIYRASKNQISYGENIGIIMLDTFVPFIPGDVGNATTFPFPVRYQEVPGLTFRKLYEEPEKALPQIITAGRKLVDAGVKAITGDCGFMILHQQEITDKLNVPVFMSSLLQLAFMDKMIGKHDKIGIVTADSAKLQDPMLEAAGIRPERVTVKGMEHEPAFAQTVLREEGTLDSRMIKEEVVGTVKQMMKEEQAISAILLECSVLSPYAPAVQEAAEVPVFDYVSMIEYVQQSLAKNRFNGPV